MSRNTSADRATVDVLFVRRPDGAVDLLPQPSASCSKCGLCGGTSATELPASGRPMRLSLPADALTAIAFGVYGLPLIGVVAGALLASALGVGDGGALAGALAGGAVSVFGLKRSARALETAVVERLAMSPAPSAQVQ